MERVLRAADRRQQRHGWLSFGVAAWKKFGDDQAGNLAALVAYYAFASIFALQGKSAETVRWLRKTVEAGMPNYPMFTRDANLARVRSSPEFVQFMAELKARYEAMQREFR